MATAKKIDVSIIPSPAADYPDAEIAQVLAGPIQGLTD